MKVPGPTQVNQTVRRIVASATDLFYAGTSGADAEIGAWIELWSAQEM